MIVARAESAQYNAPLVRFAIAVSVLEKKQFGAVSKIAAVLDHFDAGRNHQSVSERRNLITASVMIRIFEYEHFVIWNLSRLDLRIDRAADDKVLVLEDTN